MLVQCPECHDKMSSTLSACPHCGYVIPEGAVLEPYSQAAPEENSRRVKTEDLSYPFEKDEDSENSFRFFRSVFVFCKDLILFVLVLLVIAVAVSAFLIRTNLFSSREKIHKLCETDSGSGSQVDTSANRLMVKHYISKYVDCIEKFGSEDSTAPAADQQKEKPEPQSKAPANQQNDRQGGKTGVRESGTGVSEELPPDPPKTLPEDNFDF